VAQLVSVLSALRRFWQLPGSGRSIVLQSAFWLTATWFALRLIGFRRWSAFLERRSIDGNAAGNPSQLVEARSITRLLSAAASHLFVRTNCLEQASALCYVLRRRGIPAELRIGARKDSAGLEAHAWVEHLSIPLNEDRGEHLHFLPFENPQRESLTD
jgi:transglutaminase superfamily protein